MLELLAENTFARLSLLLLLFIAVAALSFVAVNLGAARAQARGRLTGDKCGGR